MRYEQINDDDDDELLFFSSNLWKCSQFGFSVTVRVTSCRSLNCYEVIVHDI